MKIINVIFLIFSLYYYSVWKDAKAAIRRMAGIKRGHIQSYLNEFCWRKRNCSKRIDAFNKILSVILRVFKVPKLTEAIRPKFNFKQLHDDLPIEKSNEEYDILLIDDEEVCSDDDDDEVLIPDDDTDTDQDQDQTLTNDPAESQSTSIDSQSTLANSQNTTDDEITSYQKTNRPINALVNEYENDVVTEKETIKKISRKRKASPQPTDRLTRSQKRRQLDNQ